METYLPIIKALLADWLQLTLDNPFYAVALAITVWLLTAILYSIRIASLKGQINASEKARLEMQNNLNAAQQQMQRMQEELAANTEQMEQARQLAQMESKRAAGLEEQITQRNQQVAGIIQSLHTSFDLGERPLPVMNDIRAEDLWQQHDRVINLLTTRLQSEQQAKAELQQSYQVEKVIRAEKEASLEKLQTTLAEQSSQVSRLEQVLEEQKNLLQEQESKAQELLFRTLEKHQAEVARLAELEQQALELVNARQQLAQLEEKIIVQEGQIGQLEKDKTAEQVKAQAQPVPLRQEQTETIIELPKTVQEVPTAPSVVEEPAIISVEEPAVISVKEQAGGVAGKLKGLFGKSKQEPISAKPEPVVTEQQEESQPAPSSQEQPSVNPAKGQLGKLKNLFGAKQQPEAMKQEEPEIQPSTVSPVKDRYGKSKYYFGDIAQQPEDEKPDEAEIQPVPSEIKQPSESAAKAQLGKLKNLLGAKKQARRNSLKEAEIQPVLSEIRATLRKCR